LIRLVLNDGQWERIAPQLPGKKGDPGATARDNRLFVEAVLWIARTGAPWRVSGAGDVLARAAAISGYARLVRTGLRRCKRRATRPRRAGPVASI
jgi:transposase